MKKGKNKNIVIILVTILIIAILSTIVVTILGNINSNDESKLISNLEDGEKLLESVSIKTSSNYYESDNGEIVIGGTHRNGFCMKKGVYLWGGKSQLYNSGSAYDKVSAYVNVLYDNIILPFGKDGSNDFYKNKMQKLMNRYNAADGKNRTISGYADWQIFEAEQFAFWNFTNSYGNPRGYSLCEVLVNEAKVIVNNNHPQKNLKGTTKVSINNSSAKIQVSGDKWTIGPFKLNNEASEFFKLSMNDITFTEAGKNSTIKDFDIIKDGKSVKGYSEYYGWKGDFYITFTHSFSKGKKYNVKLNGLNALTYTTTATSWQAKGNQPVATITRTPKNSGAEFNKEYSEPENGSYNLRISKKSTTGGSGTATFNVKQYLSGSTNVTKEFNQSVSVGSTISLTGNITISNTKSDTYVIKETGTTGNLANGFTDTLKIVVKKECTNNLKYNFKAFDFYINNELIFSDSKSGFSKGNVKVDIDHSTGYITVTFTNPSISGSYNLSILKRNSETKEAIPGVVFKVLRRIAGGTEDVKEYTTPSAGTSIGKVNLPSVQITKDNVNNDDYYNIVEAKYLDASEGKYIPIIGDIGFYVGKTKSADGKSYIIKGIKENGTEYKNSITMTRPDENGNIVNITMEVNSNKTEINIIIENNPVEPFKFTIQKTSTESNQDFLKNTNMKINRTVKEGSYLRVNEEVIHSGVLEDEEAKFRYNENDVDTDYSYYYDIYEIEAQSPYKNILGDKMFLRVVVTMDEKGALSASIEVKGIDGYNPTQEEKNEVMKYVEAPFVNEETRTISLKIKNPKNTIPVNLQLVKHQLDDKNAPVKNAVYSVKEIDANGNKINDLPGFTTDGTNKTIVNIKEGEIGKSYYYELIEETVPENYVNKISGVRIKAEINAEGKVSSSITQIKQKDSEVWESYSSSFERHTSISQPDENNNIILYMANSVKFDFNLYKKNYASNTNLEQAEKFNGTATFKIEQVLATGNKEIFNGTLEDATKFFNETEAKANATYTYKITETSVSDDFYDTLVNVPIIVKIRTDADGKVKSESYAGSNWNFENTSSIPNTQIDVVRSLIDLKIGDNNQVSLYIANMPKNYYSLQLVKVDKDGNVITSRNAKFSVGMETNNTDAEGIPVNEQETKNGILNIASGCIVDPGYTHTYEIKEVNEPLGYTKLPGTVNLAVKFTDDGKVLNDNISLRYTNGETEETIEGLKFEFDPTSEVPIIQVYIPNDSNPFEFELIKEDLKGNKVTAEEDSDGNLQGAHFNINRVHIGVLSDKTTNSTNLSFFEGNVINDVLEDGTVNDIVPAFTNLQYVYQIQEVSTKSEFVNIFDRYLINLNITTDDDSKISSADYSIIDIMNRGVTVTETFKQKYGDFIQVNVNDTKDKVTVVIKNTYGYKVRLNKTDTNGKPVEANIEAFLNAYNKEQNIYQLSSDNRKCAINGTYQVPGTSQPQIVTGETTHLSEDYIIPGETQTWTIVERGAKAPYYNIFADKYIDVEVEMNDQYELVVKGYTIKDSNTLQSVSEEELQNLSKYIGDIEFVKEGNVRVLNITLKDPVKYRLKLTKYDTDGKTELKGAVLTVNGEEVINDGKSYYEVDNITDIGKTFSFVIREKSTIKNHVNIFEQDDRYLSLVAQVVESGDIKILYNNVYEHYNGNPKPWLVPSYDEIYNYIKVTQSKDTDNVPVINVEISNPLQYEFEVKKVDTSEDKNPLDNTQFEIYSPVVKEQNGNNKYSIDKEGVTSISNSGTIYGNTTEEGKILFGEKNIEVGKVYEYKITETETSSNIYENIFKEFSIYVKVKLDGTGTVTLENYDNGKNYEIRKDDGTKASDSYYEYVTVNVDNTGDKPCIKVEIQNPTKIKLKINKKIFGEEEINLANTKFEIVSEISGTKELTTDSQGNIILDEAPVKEGIYEYIIREKESASKDIINILSDNYIRFRLHVSADGSIYTVDAQGNKADNTYELYKADGSKLDFNNTTIDNYIDINTTGKIDGISVVEVKVLDPQKYDILLLKKDKDTNELMNNVTFDITVFEQGETEKEVKLKNANTMQDKDLSGLKTSNVNGQDGVITINDILFEKAGTYKLKLHETPIEGYINIEDIEVYVTIEVVNGKYEVTNITYDNEFIDKENTKIVKEEGKDIQIIQIVVENEQVKGSYDLTINKTDLRGAYLDGAEVKVTVLRNGKESELYEANDDITSKDVIIPVQGKMQNGNLTISNIRIEKPETYTIKIEEITAPEGYVKLEEPVEINVTTKLEGEGLNARYVLASANLVDKNELVELKTSEDKLEVNIKNEQFDLALRKFITQIVTNEGQENERVQNITNREPKPITDELKNGIDTTAIYNHTKEPISLYAKDTVIYKIRVYNEADIDGYAEEVTDHLPEYLEFVNDEFNSKYGWILDESDKSLRTVRTNYLSRARDENGNLIKAFNKETGELDYKELEIKCKVKENTPANLKLTNIAEISKYIGKDGREVVDRDSEAGNVKLPEDSNLPSYKDDKITSGIDYIPGQQDDDDFEKVLIEEFDLALRKFITGVTNGYGEKEEVTTRIPVFKVDENGNYVYEHTKEPVLVANQNIVEYTIRVYNEGTVNGYAKEIKDDIPEGLEFLPDDELNKEYRWIMLDEEGNETDKVSEAKYIVTDYLSKENEKTAGENLLKAFNEEDYEAGAIKEPDYKEVKVAFKVTMPNTSDEIIINQAQISDDSDEDGNEVTDKDSTPNEWIDGEDDQDIEKIKVQYFDLALRKWVTKAIVIEDGKEVVRETGHKAEDDPEAVVKVDLKKSKLNKVVVKFEYQIRVTNEGQIAGSVEEISDYIPEGLKFVAADNPEWEEVDGKVVTDQLAGQIMQPGESKEVTILLTWINSENNMGLKVNIAEISKDYNEYGSPDIDSTPNNKVPGEDDIDDAPVMLTVTTGQEVVYLGITIAVLGIIAGGVIGIKKYVIK